MDKLSIFSSNRMAIEIFFVYLQKKLEVMQEKSNVGNKAAGSTSPEKQVKGSAYLGMMSPQLLDDLQKKIISIVVNQKKYLDKNYSAKRLSVDIGTNTRYVSATISICFKMNYTSFINKFRIEEAMMILKDKKYQDLRIEEVSDMVGFSNRQSFYTSFCRMTGITPKAYKRLNMMTDDKTKQTHK